MLLTDLSMLCHVSFRIIWESSVGEGSQCYRGFDNGVGFVVLFYKVLCANQKHQFGWRKHCLVYFPQTKQYAVSEVARNHQVALI